MLVESNHYLFDFTYSNGRIDVEQVMDNAIEAIGELTVVDKFRHNFKPFGLSLVYVLSESHISIHTWEEYNYMSVDMYTCGEASPKNTLDEFLKSFNIISKNLQIISRGV